MSKPRVLIYRCDDPACPPALRYVAHWTQPGQRGLQVAMMHGPTDAVGERLMHFLVTEIGRASKAEAKTIDPVLSAEMRRRSQMRRKT